MVFKIKTQLALLGALLIYIGTFAQLPDGRSPGGKGWADSFQANGLCWCDTTFDHDLDDINEVSFTINGVRRNIRDVCDELKKHPLVRDYVDGDPIYNDVQCGNGPANTAIDETQCPGRVDLGRDGCSEIGPRWDIAWLESRERFGGEETENPIPPTTTDGTLVHITKRNATGYAIDGGSGGTNGQNVTLSVANTADEGQLWLEIDRGNGFYSYEKFGTNYSLDGNGGGATNQNVYIWQTNATNQNQQWQKQAVGDGGYKLIKRNATGFAINGGSGGREGQNINLWSSASRNQNLQWYITPLAATTEASRLEAEDFDSMSGIQTEDSSESGDNVGYINDGDWLRFDDVNLSGITNMDARIACNFTGGTVEVRTGSVTGTLIGSIDVRNTGGNQSWTTLNTSINNTSGTQDVYLVFTGGNGYLFNINWIEFNTSSRSNKDIIATAEVSDMILYPNPVSAITTIENAENSTLNVYNMNGSMVFTQVISSESETVDLSGLATGLYYGEVLEGDSVTVVKIMKN